MIISKRREYSDYSPSKVISKPDSQEKFSFEKMEQNYLLSPSKVQNKSIKANKITKKGRYKYVKLRHLYHSIVKRQPGIMRFQLQLIVLIIVSSSLLSYNGSLGNFIRIPPPKPDQATTFEKT